MQLHRLFGWVWWCLLCWLPWRGRCRRHWWRGYWGQILPKNQYYVVMFVLAFSLIIPYLLLVNFFVLSCQKRANLAVFRHLNGGVFGCLVGVKVAYHWRWCRMTIIQWRGDFAVVILLYAAGGKVKKRHESHYLCHPLQVLIAKQIIKQKTVPLYWALFAVWRPFKKRAQTPLLFWPTRAGLRKIRLYRTEK